MLESLAQLDLVIQFAFDLLKFAEDVTHTVLFGPHIGVLVLSKILFIAFSHACYDL